MDIFRHLVVGIRGKLKVSVLWEILDLALDSGFLKPIPFLVLPQGGNGELEVLSDDEGHLWIHQIRLRVLEIGLLIDAVLEIFLMDNLTIFHHIPLTADFMVAYLLRNLNETQFLFIPLGLDEDLLRWMWVFTFNQLLMQVAVLAGKLTIISTRFWRFKMTIIIMLVLP